MCGEACRVWPAMPRFMYECEISLLTASELGTGAPRSEGAMGRLVGTSAMLPQRTADTYGPSGVCCGLCERGLGKQLCLACACVVWNRTSRSPAEKAHKHRRAPIRHPLRRRCACLVFGPPALAAGPCCGFMQGRTFVVIYACSWR